MKKIIAGVAAFAALMSLVLVFICTSRIVREPEPAIKADIQLDPASNTVVEPKPTLRVEHPGEQEQTSKSSTPASPSSQTGNVQSRPPAPFVPQTSPDTVEVKGNYTMPEKTQFEDGSVGWLYIDSIGVSTPVYETDDEMEAMRIGIAHYKTTSAWDGNIGLCAHNGNASYSYFRDLTKVKSGDEIRYETALGSRTYVVESIREISQTDWSMLSRTEDNRITLTTCIDTKPEHRLCVQAREKGVQ